MNSRGKHTGCSSQSHHMTAGLTCLLSFFFLLVVHSKNVPAFSNADENPAYSIQEWLDQGNIALEKYQWQQAEQCFDQAISRADSQQKDSIQRLLEWSRANSIVEGRYMDGSISRFIKSLDADHSQNLLNDIFTLIDQNFYGEMDLTMIAKQSILQMQASLENPLITKQYKTDGQELQLLKKELASFRDTLFHQEIQDWQHLLSLAKNLRNFSPQAGLGESWPAVELAYALCRNLDTYSHLLTPRQYETMLDQLSGFYVGIGIDLIFEGEYPTIFDVISDSPADVVGFRPGDQLIEVDGTDLKNLSSEKVKKILSGPQDSSLLVTISRMQTRLQRMVTRDLIDAPTVRHEKLLFNTIGYLRIAGFDYDTALEMKKSIQKLEKNGAKSLVIDLRCNGGGIMSAAIDAVRLFINQGTIVTVHSAQDKTEYRAGGNFFDCFSLPLVILVDKNTASAAEIFTAALKDHHRAFVIGEKTLGKGVVQTVLPLSKNSIALCLTTASFIPPCQKSFHKCGIEPDILAKIPDKGPKNALFRESSLLVDDPVLHKGICLLNRNDFDEKLKSVSTF